MIAQKPLLQCLVNLANIGSRVVAKTATKSRYIGFCST